MSMETLLSYHNDPAVKLKYQARFAAHRAADEVIQGAGFRNGRGCFVGCTLDAYDHARFPIELGWPEWLARLADAIFEGLPRAEAPQFGADLLEAVPVGKDLGPVRWQLAIARYERQLAALATNAEPYAAEVRAALTGMITYCQAQLGGIATEIQRSAAESAAWSAARSAWSAESAARSAWSAARSAARSAEL